MATELGSDALRDVLVRARVVAVVGAHTEAWRPACYVPAYLVANGYRVVPVNPDLLGQTIWGEPVRASLSELTDPVDVVAVFRRSEDVAEHVDDVLAMTPSPKVVWLQLGIRNAGAAGRLVGAGIDVVQDRCMLTEHRRFGISAIKADG